MNKYSREQICGLCEAFEYYNNILSEELQEKISEEFVNEMREMSRFNLGSKITDLQDIDAGKISREGLTYIKYMNNCIEKSKI